MIKIRLMRIGTKKKPFYRVVVVDERAKRTGAYIELLGTYDPLTEPKDIKLKQDRIDHWIKQGAKMSTGFLRIIGKAPQRPPRKPKKQGKGESEKGKEEAKPQATTEETVKPESNEAIGAVEPTETKATEVKSDEDSRLSEVREKGEDVKASADQSLSEPGEDGQKAQAMTSVTPSEPVTNGASEASLTGEQANIEPTPESEKTK